MRLGDLKLDDKIGSMQAFIRILDIVDPDPFTENPRFKALNIQVPTWDTRVPPAWDTRVPGSNPKTRIKERKRVQFILLSRPIISIVNFDVFTKQGYSINTRRESEFLCF